MYKLIVTENAYDYLNGVGTNKGINFIVDDIDEALDYLEAFVQKQFAVIVEEGTV